ncbi:hypothetical protein ACJX0J_010488, partial [Zea mays]
MRKCTAFVLLLWLDCELLLYIVNLSDTPTKKAVGIVNLGLFGRLLTHQIFTMVHVFHTAQYTNYI